MKTHKDIKVLANKYTNMLFTESTNTITQSHLFRIAVREHLNDQDYKVFDRFVDQNLGN